MKNIKVSLKILMGFGIVVALMILITGVTSITNTGIISNVDAVRIDSEFQTKCNNLKTDFMEARLKANVLYEIISEEVYTEYSELAKAVDADYADILNYINENEILSKFSQYLTAFGDSYTQWKSNVEKVHDSDVNRTTVTAEMNSHGPVMLETSTKILSSQMEQLKNDASNNLNTEQILYRGIRIESAIDINNTITSFRVGARGVVSSLNTTGYEDVVAKMDATISKLEEFKESSQLTSTKEISQEAVDAVSNYKEAFIKFINVCIESDKAVADAKVLGITSKDNLNAVLTHIDEAMMVRISETQASTNLALIVVIVVAVLSLVVAIVLGIYISGLLSKPLVFISNLLLNIGQTGNLDLDPEKMAYGDKIATQKDEIGVMFKSIEILIKKMLTPKANMMNRIADGDLTVDIELMSSQDTLGNAMAKMTDNLNNMFSEINQATSQVATGASQIADGSQVLAQGSTEQASAVEELSSTITDISDKTKANSELANKAANLANLIKDNAQKGSSQMDNMVKAVKDINDASVNINKVIKVIDDIAFQTNILALNAAVEAARAGQHGKVFAVVAEEVRNLAAKSAEAAKDTGIMIVNSMEKAELGVKIATETSSSLNEIVDGINESSVIVSNIAKSSEEQSLAISQVNRGIDQVAQVIQQNSATAEQSAAASEEMSGQSAMLESLVAQFKLKNQTSSYSGISSSGNSSPVQKRKANKTLSIELNDDFGKY